MNDVNLLDSVALGSFNNGVPYIDMNVDGDLLSIFQRQISRATTQGDKEYASTLFHEYIHQIQAALLYPMQLWFVRRQWQIYEIHAAGMEKIRNGESVLKPIKYSSAYQKQLNTINATWQYAYIGTDKANCISSLELVEGIARILQEAYYGVRENDTRRYTATRSAVESVLGVGVLSTRELLDISEVALRTNSPGYAFYRLILSLKGSLPEMRNGNFYANVTCMAHNLGMSFAPDLADEIVANIQRLFVSNVFVQLQRSMTQLYQGLKMLFKISPVFSYLYSLTMESAQKKEGLFPFWFMIVLWKVGSPPIRNANGILEQLSHTAYSERDQTSIALESVIDSVVAGGQDMQCGMYNACVKSHKNGLNVCPDSMCLNRPWGRTCAGGQACPYQAVWKAMGLEGLRLTNS